MIRRAKISEITDILTITKACAEHMIGLGILQWNEYYPSKIVFENDIDSDALFIMENSGKIIGTITITPLMDVEYEPIEWLTPNSNNIYIHRLSIHPKEQGKGFAKELMDFAEQFAREKGYVSVRLDTFSQNIRNQKFYEARGYRRLSNIYFPKQSEFPFHCYELLL